ncbi:MAG: VOC family protein [Pyrinomonadaceae bacterium]|nr:VOC family protein [Pyrinomonadaceae bacterium]
MPRVVHFEISVDEPERAAKFYSDVFGWNSRKWDGPQEYWMISTGKAPQAGIDGGMYKRHEGMSFASHVNTIDVPSVDEYVAKVTENGGTLASPKIAIPSVGYFAYCRDTEGNMFGIMEGNTNAK